MNLKTALINSEQAKNDIEANALIHEMRNRVYNDGEDPEEVLADYGLEPDYVFDLIG